MSDSQFHLANATAFLVMGAPCLLLPRRVAAWLRRRAWAKGQPDWVVKAYGLISTDRGVRCIGVFLFIGTVTQLWASWIMRRF